MIDEPEDDFKLAYALTKPLKVGMTYDRGGIYKFVMQEVYTTEFDNIELGIADYYRYYNEDGTRREKDITEIGPSDGQNYDDDHGDGEQPEKKVWF